MAISQEIDQVFKAAMKERDQPTLDVVRMLKTRVQERTTAKGFAGEVDDALWTEVIGAYSKQMKKAAAEYEKLGERGEEQLGQIGFELEFCARFLPSQLGEDELRVLVQARIDELSMTDAKQVGRLIGALMKTHKGQVEAGDVKRIAEEILAG
jgi:uncharacterized protein YqeY